MTKEAHDIYAIGSRIVHDDSLGTVKFVGALEGKPGIWLGIEWDDETRGKHNGTYKGKQYFSTRHPTSGSFIRSVPKTHRSVVEAIIERYGEQSSGDAGVIQDEMFVMGRGQRTTVEVVGAQSVNKQQSKFNELRTIVLRGEYVSEVGEDGAVGALIPNVVDLDLSRSLFTSWSQISAITKQLPRLTNLNVSECRLSLNGDKANAEAFSTVRVLFMNRMSYNWTEICDCAKLWSDVQVLHLCFNRVQTIDNLTNLQNIRLLNLESNPIQQWENVLPLGHLPELSTLILNSCELCTIRFPDVEFNEKTKLFPKLKTLSLSRNKIEEMSSIHEMDKLASLEEINLINNPISDPEKGTIRYIVCACIANLKAYNRTKYTKQERRHCEWDYVKAHGNEWKASGGNQQPEKNKPSQEFCNKHPRYMYLLSVYGVPEDSELIQYSSAISKTLISLKFVCPAKPEKVLTKKIPGTMTIQKLKMLLRKLYKIKDTDIELSYRSPETTDEYPLDNDQKELDFYSVNEGDTIYIK